MAWNTRTQCVWIVMLMIMAGSCSVALKCEDNCDGCSTTSIICYCSAFNAQLPEIVSVLPPHTQALSYVATGDCDFELGESNFEHLTELKVLNITNFNDSGTGSLKFYSSQQHVFAPLTKLQVLKINVQWNLFHPLDDLFKPLTHLEELDLSETIWLNATYLRRAMYGLSNSTMLKTVKLSHIQEKGIFPVYISTLNLAWFLKPLQNCPIRHLNLANNDLRTIFPGIIRYTPLLEYIDVSHNLLEGFDVDSLVLPPLVQEIFLHKGLQEADYSYQGPRYPAQEGFGNKRSNLSTGTYQQRISSLVYSGHWSQCIKDLVYSYDRCVIFSPNCSDAMDYLRHNHSAFCEVLYARGMFEHGIPCSALPAIDDVYQKHCPLCVVYPTMGSLKRLKLHNEYNWDKKFNDVYTPKRKNFCFHQSNQWEYLDVSESVDLVQDFVAAFQQFTGLKHIKVLNVSNTGITSVFEHMLLTFPNLQVMDMSRNKILFYQEKPVSLSSNRDIQFLSFAYNQINFVPQNLFPNLVSLRQLDLSHNHIHDFDFNISRLYSLENLNLESNMISEIPEATREQLIQLAERIAPRVVTVDLSNNQLDCSCSYISSLSFMSQTKPTNLVFKNYDKYFCHNQADDRIHLYNLNLRSLWFNCLGSGVYVGIGFACAFVVITMILLLGVIIYRKRWWFRYQYFLAHRVYQNYNKIATFDTPFEYDLFVSYNRSDYQWVDEVLQPKLEDELGLRLCLHHRDFRLGEVITEQIIESVQSSKKTLFILSKSFLASTWCHFEIQMAQSRLFTTGKDVILLALLEPLPDRMVSKTLKGLLETRTYVEWTENDTYGQKLFWEKLYESVKAPISQPFDLENRAPPHGIQAEDSRDPSSEEAAREREPLLASSRSELSDSWHQV